MACGQAHQSKETRKFRRSGGPKFFPGFPGLDNSSFLSFSQLEHRHWCRKPCFVFLVFLVFLLSSGFPECPWWNPCFARWVKLCRFRPSVVFKAFPERKQVWFSNILRLSTSTGAAG